MSIDRPEPSEEDLGIEGEKTPRERYSEGLCRVIDHALERDGRDNIDFTEDDVREIKKLELEVHGEKIPDEGIVLTPETIAKTTEYLRSYVPDGIRRARAKSEPPISDEDIHSFEGLIALNGQVVKYTLDDGESWHYARLQEIPLEDIYEEDDSFFVTEGTPAEAQPEQTIRPEILFRGLTAYEEIISYGPDGKYRSGSMSQTFNERSFRDGLPGNFKKGFIVRPTTPEEVEGMEFSFDFLKEYDS